VPSDLAAVLLECMAKDPKERFQSIAELEAALAACACADDWSATAAADWWTAPVLAGDSGERTDTNRTTHWQK
jgi:eukaryotic-like serine/threonine-protein kinase